MTCARSARMLCILGATLIAHTLPIVAYGSGAGSRIRGIDQADVRGIDQADVLGIDQADVLGIDQADVLGIDQADMLGIDQADTQGIISSTLVLVGVVESIDYVNGTFRAVGQIVFSNMSMLESLRVGDLVSVEGTIAGPGLLYADAVSVSPQQYVAGATEVFVTGVLSSRDVAAGTAMIGELQVDYTSSLASGDAQNGVVWTFRGTQPSQKGVMLSDRVQAY